MAFWPQKWSEAVATDLPPAPVLATEPRVCGYLDEKALLLEAGLPAGWWLRGWAALTDEPSPLDTLELAIFNEETAFVVPVTREPRPDVAHALGSPSYQHSGFFALVPNEPFIDGDFRLGVRVSGTAGEAVFDTGHVLHVRSGRPYLPERAGQPPLLHVVHVPKTAGTSFGQLLERWFGRTLELTYEGPLMVGPQTRCVHGHRYASALLQYDRDVRIAMWFRDPVERVVSEYFHWRRNPATHPLEGADLLSFARRREMVNMHRRMLDDVPLERLAFVGLTEHFDASLELFCRIFDKSQMPVAAQNCNPDKAPSTSYALPASLRAEIARANRADIELYALAERRFRKLCEQYGVKIAA